MYKYLEKEVEIGDVVLWTELINEDEVKITPNKPYLVVNVGNGFANVINDVGEVSKYIELFNVKIIKTKNGNEAESGDTCIIVDKNSSVIGDIVKVDSSGICFMSVYTEKHSILKDSCVVLEEEKQKQTLQDYLAENGILDKFIYNTKNTNEISESKTISSSFSWENSPEGYLFWSVHYDNSPTYDGSMDWITDDSEEPKEKDSFCIMFNSIDDIKEAIELNVLDHYHGYIKGEINDKNFPTIFKKRKSLGLSHQSNNGKKNTWLKPKYKDWVKESVAWNKYKEQLIKEKEENKKQTIERESNNKCSANEKNSIRQFKTDFETSMEEPWIGIIYYESGSENLSVRAKSEEELDKLFEDSCYKDMTMQKFKLKSTRKGVIKFTDTLV